jgi:hypothetical protein
MGIIQEVICPLNYHVLRYEICCGYMQECYNNYMNQPLKAQASSHSCCKVIYATHPISNVSASPTFFFTPTQHMTSPSSHEVLFPSSSSSYTLLSLKIPIHSETRKGGGLVRLICYLDITSPPSSKGRGSGTGLKRQLQSFIRNRTVFLRVFPELLGWRFKSG